jgi:hypothetical protein
MGRWSRHPMGSDGALDARDTFMLPFDMNDKEDGNPLYFFERPEEEIRDGLLNLSLEEIKKMSEFGECISENKFVIPYTFVEYKAYPTDPEIKKFLLECLDSHDDLTGLWNYCNGEEMVHVNFFKENFEDIISGKKELEPDAGLLATIYKKMASGEPGLVNLTSEDKED